MRRVVITGIGAVTPIGNTAPEFIENAISGKSGATPITKFDTTNFKTKFACEVKNFVPENHFDRKELRKLDPFCQYALVAVEEALSNSGLDISSIDPARAGVIWGSGYGGVTTMFEQTMNFADNGRLPRFTPFFIPRSIINMAAGLISIKYGFKGINFAPVAACATSNVAILESLNNIRWGKADIIVCGGSEAAIDEGGIGGFNAAMALSTNNDSPETACRPFDVTRDGFVMAEGAGALIIEELEHAQRRGATILAELAGGAMTCDAYHITASHPEGEGSKNAMKLALEDAGLKPEDVDYINAHATSTPLGDVSEINAIMSVFGEHAKKLNISASKSMTGHMLGAAGAAEAILCVNSVKNDIIAPSINARNIDPQIPEGLNLTLDKAQQRTVNVALNNTFGFGGHNVITVFKKFRE
ncbi:MAG: beta-ketoacyl-ACP synthase II [Bacteroidota bacterium]|nr:beta-ketoacyl-ACP synthase II [Bacteroidota bacterium]